MMGWFKQSVYLVLALLPVSISVSVADELEEKPVRCINLNQIKEVKVLNNQQILFRMTGGKNYINVLPHKCFGLRRNQPFMYRVSNNRLCDLDIITVLDQGGFGMRPLGSCGLGTFDPMLDDDVQTLKNTKVVDE